jgi:hypothetical protein
MKRCTLSSRGKVSGCPRNIWSVPPSMAIAATRNRQTCTTRWLIGIGELEGTALSRLGWPDRHHAEALGFDAERHVELAAEVLERHRRSQLDDLGPPAGR